MALIEYQPMTQFLISKYGANLASMSIEVQIDNTSGKYFLQDDSILRSRKVVAIGVHANSSTSAKSPLGRDLISPAALDSAYINLMDGNESILENHPLSDLALSDDCCYNLLDACNINPTKSSITISDATSIAAGQSVLLVFFYEK